MRKGVLSRNLIEQLLDLFEAYPPTLDQAYDHAYIPDDRLCALLLIPANLLLPGLAIISLCTYQIALAV